MSNYSPHHKRSFFGNLSTLDVIKDILLFTLVISMVVLPTSMVVLDDWSFTLRIYTPLVAITIAVVGRLFVIWAYQHKNVKMVFDKFLRPSQYHVAVAKENDNKLIFKSLIAISLVIAIFIPLIFSNYITSVMIQSLIYIILGLGLNIIVGWAGLLHLGFVAFYAVGAYTLAISHIYFGIGFWQAIPIAAIVSAFFGVLLVFPVLRLYGDYLAIVTLGFAEIVRMLIVNLSDITGGSAGMSTPLITFFGIPFSREGDNSFSSLFNIEFSSDQRSNFTYFVLLAFVILITLIVKKLRHSPIGRSWEAMRENEIACKSIGINVAKLKILAFAIAAAIAGVAGCFFGASQGFVSPTSFTFIESAMMLAIVVLGGLGSITGTIIAALILNWLPELLRDMESVRILIFGLAMVLMMLWRPTGLVKIVRPHISRT